MTDDTRNLPEKAAVPMLARADLIQEAWAPWTAAGLSFASGALQMACPGPTGALIGLAAVIATAVGIRATARVSAQRDQIIRHAFEEAAKAGKDAHLAKVLALVGI